MSTVKLDSDVRLTIKLLAIMILTLKAKHEAKVEALQEELAKAKALIPRGARKKVSAAQAAKDDEDMPSWALPRVRREQKRWGWGPCKPTSGKAATPWKAHRRKTRAVAIKPHRRKR